MIRMKNNITPRLPNEYQEVEYIESTGTQYIDTGYCPYKTKTEVKFKYTGSSNVSGVYILASWTSNNRYYPVSYTGTLNGVKYNQFRTANKTNIYTNLGAYDSEVHSVIYNDEENKVYFDNILKTTVTDLDTPNTNSIYLFAMHGSTGAENSSSCRIFSVKLMDKITNTIARNFIPCYRKSDNEIGMYDLVSNQFYTNAGTGVFLMGTEVNKADVNLKPIIGNKKVLKRYIGENLVYQKNRDTFFTSCPFPTSWTEVTAGTQYKATNEYGEWNIYADDCYDNGSSGVNKAFDGIVSTAHNFKEANFTNKYIEIDLPNGVLIKPLSPKIIYHFTGTCKFQGFNPNIDNWEDLLTLPANSSSGNKTITDEISTSNFYSKFRVETASYSKKVPTYMCEIEITSGTLRKEN